MEAIPLKSGQSIRVRWSDSSYAKGWHYPPFRFGSPLRHIESIGFVVQSDAEVLVISTSKDQDTGCLCPTFIPWGAVEECA